MSEDSMQLLARVIRNSITAKSKASNVDKLVTIAQSKLGLTLIPVVVDESTSSLLSWGRNDDPTPGTIEQVVAMVYRLTNEFKHQTLAVGMLNELKTNKLYICINYVQRTLFISRI